MWHIVAKIKTQSWITVVPITVICARGYDSFLLSNRFTYRLVQFWVGYLRNWNANCSSSSLKYSILSGTLSREHQSRRRGTRQQQQQQQMLENDDDQHPIFSSLQQLDLYIHLLDSTPVVANRFVFIIIVSLTDQRRQQHVVESNTWVGKWQYLLINCLIIINISNKIFRSIIISAISIDMGTFQIYKCE